MCTSLPGLKLFTLYNTLHLCVYLMLYSIPIWFTQMDFSHYWGSHLCSFCDFALRLAPDGWLSIMFFKKGKPGLLLFIFVLFYNNFKEKIYLLFSKNPVATFWATFEKFGLLFIIKSGHNEASQLTDVLKPYLFLVKINFVLFAEQHFWPFNGNQNHSSI